MNKSLDKISGMDIFAGVNTLFFLYMCYAAYYDRFIHYRGHRYLWEFFVYAAVILVLILLAWKKTRHIRMPSWILVLIQVGIVIHFLGGLAIWHESRLYDKIILGVRYDKYVHLFNAFIGTTILNHLYFKSLGLKNTAKDFHLILVVLGLGAMIEMVEYLVTLTAITNGVGGYDNNMMDMISNLTGSILAVLTTRIISARTRRNL